MPMLQIGLRVREARHSREMSLAALARACNLSKGFLSQLENGASDPSLGSLTRLAVALEVPLAALLAEEHTPAPLPSDISLRVVRHVPTPFGRSSLRIVNNSPEQLTAFVELAPTARLAGSGARQDGGTLAVMGGAVRLACRNSTVRLLEGDSATWGAGSEYEVANVNGSRASLILVLAGSSALPTLIDAVTARPAASLDRRESRQAGPLRLVAMRAARTAEQGR